MLAGLLALPLIALWSRRRRRRERGLVVAGLSRLPPMPRSPRARLRHVPLVLRFAALFVLVAAAAGPRWRVGPATSASQGREILIALDTSDSMLTEDFQPNRLEAAKRLIDEFISEHPEDRIALLVFAAEAHLLCPSTLDHQRLRGFVAGIRPGVAGDGTAIGLAVAAGVARLRTSPSKGRALVLLTDGVSTREDIEGEDAAALAAREGVRVHAIGVGSEGLAPFPVGPFHELVPTILDEPALRELSETSGGRFFRATDEDVLRAVFHEIEGLERSRLEGVHYGAVADATGRGLLLGAVLLAAEALLSATVLRGLP